MADHKATTTRPTGRRRGPDGVGLLMGMLFLVVAAVGFSGDPWWLLSANIAWIVAGAVGIVGIALLISTLPRRGPKD
jgi:hypothetical protein